VAALCSTPDLLDVSDGSRQRALLITQAIAAECSQRGYQFGLRDDGEPSFQITIGEDQFHFTLSEEREGRDVIDAEKLAAAKYPWQRIPSTVQQVPSGRLVLRLGSGYGSLSWADRMRWTLDQKLPHMLKEITSRASATDRATKAQRRGTQTTPSGLGRSNPTGPASLH
jgi:hypothetical protein